MNRAFKQMRKILIISNGLGKAMFTGIEMMHIGMDLTLDFTIAKIAGGNLLKASSANHTFFAKDLLALLIIGAVYQRCA